MHDFFNAVVLGIVEGLTEFLPVSSTGHLLIFNQWFHFDQPAFNTLFDIVVQMGAILAVVVVFWKRLVPFLPSQSPETKKDIWSLWGKALIGTVPALVVGALFGTFVEEHFFNVYTVAAALVLYGVLFIVIEMTRKKTRIETTRDISLLWAFLIGLIQVLAFIPGTSRSGSTILGAMLLGVGRVAAAEFSFYLAIPTMGAATLYSLYKFVTHNQGGFTGGEILALAVGLVTAFLVAWAVIVAFLKFIQKHTFLPFGVYRVVLGVVVLGYFLATGAQIIK